MIAEPSYIIDSDVCNQFGVQYHDTFAMLKALRVRYDYLKES